MFSAGKKCISFCVTFVCMCCISCESDAQNDNEPTYSRQDCIVKIDLDWQNSSANKIESVIQAIGTSLNDALNTGKVNYLPSYTFPWKKRDEWYLQFNNNCENKAEMADQLIQTFVINRVKDMPLYQISKEKITPHPSTIYIKGDSWKEDSF